MYYRRKVLLHLIASFARKGISKLDLPLLLFLFCRKQAIASFDFIPYHDACFSFQANKDLDVLSKHYGYAEDKKNRWLISRSIPNIALTDEDKSIFDEIKKEFYSWSNEKITEYIVTQHPYYAIHRRLKLKNAVAQESVLKEQRKIKKKTKPVLFTLGYEGRSIDSYLNELVTNNIKLLCDVRKSPLSMKYGFSKKQLQDYCQKIDITYEHIPELGIVAEKRKILKESKNYDVMFREYRKQLPAKKTALDKVVSLLHENKRIALCCFEKAAEHCHRHCISKYLEKKMKIVSVDL